VSIQTQKHTTDCASEAITLHFFLLSLTPTAVYSSKATPCSPPMLPFLCCRCACCGAWWARTRSASSPTPTSRSSLASAHSLLCRQDTLRRALRAVLSVHRALGVSVHSLGVKIPPHGTIVQLIQVGSQSSTPQPPIWRLELPPRGRGESERAEGGGAQRNHAIIAAAAPYSRFPDRHVPGYALDPSIQLCTWIERIPAATWQHKIIRSGTQVHELPPSGSVRYCSGSNTGEQYWDVW